MNKKRILCVGNAVLDKIFTVPAIPHTSGKFFATSYLEVGGGPAATASVAIARLGQNAHLWSRIGDDPAGDSIVKELQGYGVNMNSLKRLEGVVSSIASIAVDQSGERMIINYIDPKFPQHADWLPLENIAGYDCILSDVRWPAAGQAVLTEAKKHGIPSVLDADLSPQKEALTSLVPLADHVIFSEGGLEQFSSEKDPETGLRKTAAEIKGTPYVTLGEKGCLWLADGTIHRAPAFTVKAVDTTGAGDVFHGAFALALAEGQPTEQCIRFAAGAAALKCTRQGGRAGIPERTSLEDFLKQN